MATTTGWYNLDADVNINLMEEVIDLSQFLTHNVDVTDANSAALEYVMNRFQKG
jgi:hypothetical protein